MAAIPIQRVIKVLRAAQRSPTNQAGEGPYSAVVTSNETILRHYGTMIYHSTGRYGRNNSIVSLGGYTASDRDAIASAMSFDGILGKVTKSAPTAKKYGGKAIGGWYIY